MPITQQDLLEAIGRQTDEAMLLLMIRRANRLSKFEKATLQPHQIESYLLDEERPSGLCCLPAPLLPVHAHTARSLVCQQAAGGRWQHQAQHQARVTSGLQVCRVQSSAYPC
jgi:hypothetical protein